jgi:hypothetical protein
MQGSKSVAPERKWSEWVKKTNAEKIVLENYLGQLVIESSSKLVK